LAESVERSSDIGRRLSTLATSANGHTPPEWRPPGEEKEGRQSMG
jgi:hypothetical protein